MMKSKLATSLPFWYKNTHAWYFLDGQGSGLSDVGTMRENQKSKTDGFAQKVCTLWSQQSVARSHEEKAVIYYVFRTYHPPLSTTRISWWHLTNLCSENYDVDALLQGLTADCDFQLKDIKRFFLWGHMWIKKQERLCLSLQIEQMGDWPLSLCLAPHHNKSIDYGYDF